MRIVSSILFFMLLHTAALAQGFGGINLGLPNSHGVINPNALLVANPMHTADFGFINCFANANDVGDFYGGPTMGGDGGEPYQEAAGGGTGYGIANPTGFFTGSPSSNAQLCFIRVGLGGGRARLFSARICYWLQSPPGTQTACETAVTTGPNTALTALKGVSAGTLTWNQNGTTLNATGINLTSATSLTDVLTTVQTALSASYPTISTITGGTVTTTTCVGINGTVGAGWINVTSVSPTNCIYPGGNIPQSPGGVYILSQVNGTPNGAGLYTTSSLNSRPTLSPYTCVACTLTYNTLTVTTATNGIGSGQGVYDTTTPANLGNQAIYGQLVAGVENQGAVCASSCNGTTWILFNQLGGTTTQSTDVWVTSICHIQIVDTPYIGATVNSSRWWIQDYVACPDQQPVHTLSYFTSGADNLAALMGLAANSLPAGPSSPAPAWLASSVPDYAGPALSASSQVLLDPGDPSFMGSWSAWLANLYATVPGATQIGNFQVWRDPDVGAQTNLNGQSTTYKTEISNWFAANQPNRVYARVWFENAYPQALYAGNSPVGLPTCVPGTTILTVTGTLAPNYCPRNDFILIGAGGSTSAATAGPGTGDPGGTGASGGATWLQSVTTNSGIVPIDGTTSSSIQVGVGGSGNTAGNETEIVGWPLISGGIALFATSGANAAANSVTGATAGNNLPCTASGGMTMFEGTFATCTNFKGANGTSGTATVGDGGVGGPSSATLVHAGFTSVTSTITAGSGGAGTNGNGVAGSSTTGGASGAYLDSSSTGTGGISPSTAATNGGGGFGAGGSTTLGTSVGAAGHADTEFSGLTQPCGSNGPGGGGGGGGSSKGATGTASASNGGNGANYGGVGGSGGTIVSVGGGTNGSPGTSAGGFFCRIGYRGPDDPVAQGD